MNSSTSSTSASQPWSLSFTHPFNSKLELVQIRPDVEPGQFYDILTREVFTPYLRADYAGGTSARYEGNEAREFIVDLAAQVMRKAPPNFVGTLLSCLSCALWVSGDPYELINLPDANQRTICGRVFKVGEVVWTCRQCAKDSTCVQCDTCFRNSDHEGHEVYFHRAAATSGGCCDCGDEEAWAIGGNCSKHSRASTERDPLDAIPPDLYIGLESVMMGALGVTVSYSTMLVRSLNIDEEHNPFALPMWRYRRTREDWLDDSELDKEAARNSSGEELPGPAPDASWDHIQAMDYEMCVCVHNDDVHTYEDVTRAFMQYVYKSNTPEAQEKAQFATKTVDQEGYYIIAKCKIDGTFDREESNKMRDLHAMAEELSTPIGEAGKGLVVGVIPVPLMDMERNVQSYLNWAQELGKNNDGICRMMTNVFLMDTSRLPDRAAAMVNPNERNGLAFGCCRPTEIFSETLPDLPSFDMRREFPMYLKHLRDYAEEVYSQADDIHLHADGEEEKGKDFNQEAVRLTTKPFMGNCQRSALAVLMLASVYLPKRVKDRISSLVVIYQQDAIFKGVFSQTLTILYPAMYALSSRYIGTRSEEIFNTTVQVYTANRIVTMMSSDGYLEGQRPLPEPKEGHVQIAKMLAYVCYNSMIHLGCSMEKNTRWPLAPDRDKFLKSHALINHRHQQVFRDFEYVTENIVGNLNLLTGDRDEGVLWIWLGLCTILQGMYAIQRATTAHVEHEEQVMWHTSTNLTLEVESASTNIISNSLFPSDELLVAEAQVASGKTGSDASQEIRVLQNVAVERSAKVFSEGFHRWAHQVYMSDLHVRELGKDHDLHEQDESLKEPGRYEGSMEVMGHKVLLPGSLVFMRFVVARDHVSINFPLHRLVAKLFLYAAYSDLELDSAFSHFSGLDSSSILSLADYPLRVMSFSQQVDNQMWVRNGQAVSNLSYNYNHGPIVKYLKVMDIHAVQVALIAFGEIHGPSLIMTLLMDRCGVSKLMEPTNFLRHATLTQFSDPGYARQALLEYQGPMLASMLKVLSDIIVCTPNSLTNYNPQGTADEGKPMSARPEYADSVEDALSREIASLVLSGVDSLGQLQMAKLMVGGDKTVNDSVAIKVTEKLCSKRAGGGGSGEDKGTLEPRPEALKYFNPEFSHRSQEQLNKATDEVREMRRKDEDKGDKGDGQEEDRPLVNPEVIPAANRFFEPVRNLLYHPMFYSILTRSIELAVMKKPLRQLRQEETDKGELILGPSSRVIAERIVYLLTAHIHIKSRKRDMTNFVSKQSYSAFTVGAMATDVEAASSSVYNWRQAACLTTSNDGSRALLNGIADLWFSPLMQDDPLYREGLHWVIKQIALDEGNTGALELFAGRGLVFRKRADSMGNSPVDDKKAEIAKKRAAAQRNAMLNMQKQAAAFAMSMDDLSSSDDEGSSPRTSTAGAVAGRMDTDKANKSLPKCIICREGLRHEDDGVGTICYVQPSTVLKNALLHEDCCRNCDDPSSKTLATALTKQIYRVVARKGCFVYKSANPGTPVASVRSANIIGRLAHGEHVMISRRVNRWVLAVSPIRGWVEIYTEREKASQETVAALNAGKGVKTNSRVFDHCSDDTSIALVTNLFPLSGMLFNRFGDARLHASTCGHHMHYDCWDAYYASSVHQAELRQNWNNEYRAALNIRAGEFTCPLCKSVSNSWLPHVTCQQGSTYWTYDNGGGSDNDGDASGGVLQLNLGSMPKPSRNASFLSARVRSLLDLPDIPVWGRGVESHQYVGKCMFLHKFAWVSNSRESGKLLESETDQRELELTRGVQILSGSIAYTIQSNMAAAKWVEKDQTKPVAAFQSEDSLKFAASQLHLLRQAPNWFPSRESFEDCIGTPLKLLLSGHEGTQSSLTLDDESKPIGGKVCHFSSADSDKLLADYLGNRGALEIDVRRALQTSPYKHIVSKVSVPSATAMGKQQQAWASTGIPAAELWGFLSVPLLSMDLHAMAVLAVANATNVQAAKQVVSLMSLARLCQLLLEPGNTGLSDRLCKDATRLYERENLAPPSLPFRHTAFHKTLDELKRVAEKKGTAWGEGPDSSGTSSVGSEGVSLVQIDESAFALQTLQETLVEITGDCSNPAWTTNPERALRGALDAWIPFLEYSVALLQTLDWASSGSASVEAPYSTLPVDSSITPAVLKHVMVLCEALSLPAEIKDIASSPLLTLFARQWAMQLAVVQRGGEENHALKSALSSPPLVPALTTANALDAEEIRRREAKRFENSHSRFYHETSIFGSSHTLVEFIASLTEDEVGQVMSQFQSPADCGDNGNNKEGNGDDDPMDVVGSGELLNLVDFATPETREQLRMVLEREELGPAVAREVRSTLLALLEGRDGSSDTHLMRSLKKQRVDAEFMEAEGIQTATTDTPAECSVDALQLIDQAREGYLQKLNRMNLKSVEKHADTQLDEGIKKGAMLRLADALMACSNEDLVALQGLSDNDSATIGERFGELLVHKAKVKSAQEIGVTVTELAISVPFGTSGQAASAQIGGRAKADSGSLSGNLKEIAGIEAIGVEEEEEKMLQSLEPLKTWKLVGVDPIQRRVDEILGEEEEAFYTQAPFVGSLQGSQPCWDLSGQPTSLSWPDLSHLSLHHSTRGGLVGLPNIYTDLIQSIRLPYKPCFDESGRRIDEPTMCLICGCIVRAGNRAKDIESPAHMDIHLDTYPGECTLHARSCGGGQGVFFNIMSNWVLLLNGPRACKFLPLYLDKNGEAGEGRGPNRPLMLSNARYTRLEELYLKHQVAGEVSRRRLNQDRNIRANYY